VLAWTQPTTTTDSIYNVTFQRMLIADMLANRSTCAATGGRGSANGGRWVVRIDWHHNLLYNCDNRSMSGGGGSAPITDQQGVQVINNLIYYWGAHASRSTDQIVKDYINNVWEREAGSCTKNVFVRHKESDPGFAGLFASGNLFTGVCDTRNNADNFQIFTDDSSPWPQLIASNFKSSALPAAPVPITVEPAFAVKASVLSSVGADERVNCSGMWVRALDSHDANRINKAASGQVPDSSPAVPPLPSITAAPVCADTDLDGMPDAWEDLYLGTNKNVADAGLDPDGDGWLSIEEYLNRCSGGVSCSPDS